MTIVQKKIIKNLLFHMPSVYEAIQILCNYMKGPRSEMYHSSWWHRYMRPEADVVSEVRYGTVFADGNKSVSIKENPKKYCKINF